MGGREVSRPYWVCFSLKASGFYPWGDATALAGEGGVMGVVCLIQASASNHKPKKSQTKANQSKPKGRFFWFVYAKGIPKEPSLWFVVYVVCLKSDMPHHQRQVRSTGIAKRLFFYVFVSVPQYFSTEPFSY
ncbi:MAG: hypothetical protein MSS42_02975 [Bacteroidales bacterium]|nr:hypothetical protein [Bacteroidales bacterium]